MMFRKSVLLFITLVSGALPARLVVEIYFPSSFTFCATGLFAL